MSIPLSRRRGVSLIEGTLYTVIALGVVAGGIVYFQKSQVASQTTATARDAVGLSAQVRGLYERQDSFAGLDAATVISAGIVPAASLDEAGTGILSAFGTPVDIAPEDAKGTDDIFVVHLRDLDRAPCTRLGTVSLDGTGPMGTGIVAMGITPEDGEMVAGQLGEGLSPSQAAEACGAVGNTITAAYAPGMDAAFGAMEVAGLEAGPPDGFYYGQKENGDPVLIEDGKVWDEAAGRAVNEGNYWDEVADREVTEGKYWSDEAGREITQGHYADRYGGDTEFGFMAQKNENGEILKFNMSEIPSRQGQEYTIRKNLICPMVNRGAENRRCYKQDGSFAGTYKPDYPTRAWWAWYGHSGPQGNVSYKTE